MHNGYSTTQKLLFFALDFLATKEKKKKTFKNNNISMNVLMYE